MTLDFAMNKTYNQKAADNLLVCTAKTKRCLFVDAPSRTVIISLTLPEYIHRERKAEKKRDINSESRHTRDFWPLMAISNVSKQATLVVY